MINLFDYKQALQQDGVIFSFSGPMSHEVIEGIGSAIRIKFGEGKEGNKNIALKVFAIFVEQVENVINYSAEKNFDENDLSFGVIVIGKKESVFFIMGGNKIENEKVDVLNKHLTKLSVMDKQQLKVYYKQQRRAETDNDSKGAGIGFIEMARKSTRTLQFNFQKIDDKFSFFTIKIEI